MRRKEGKKKRSSCVIIVGRKGHRQREGWREREGEREGIREGREKGREVRRSGKEKTLTKRQE